MKMPRVGKKRDSLDNAPNCLVGCVIQKRTTLLCAQLRWAFSNYYTEFAHEQNCNADISESPFCGGHWKKVAVKIPQY